MRNALVLAAIASLSFALPVSAAPMSTAKQPPAAESSYPRTPFSSAQENDQLLRARCPRIKTELEIRIAAYLQIIKDNAEAISIGDRAGFDRQATRLGEYLAYQQAYVELYDHCPKEYLQ